MFIMKMINLRNLENTLNQELKELNQWLCVNRLALNVNKTNFVLFHTFNKPIKENITLNINRIAIQEQKYIKYLGVLLVYKSIFYSTKEGCEIDKSC